MAVWWLTLLCCSVEHQSTSLETFGGSLHGKTSVSVWLQCSWVAQLHRMQFINIQAMLIHNPFLWTLHNALPWTMHFQGFFGRYRYLGLFVCVYCVCQKKRRSFLLSRDNKRKALMTWRKMRNQENDESVQWDTVERDMRAAAAWLSLAFQWAVPLSPLTPFLFLLSYSFSVCVVAFFPVGPDLF